MQNILQVGAITSTHGLVGEVKVFPTTDDPKRFRTLKSVLLGAPRPSSADIRRNGSGSGAGGKEKSAGKKDLLEKNTAAMRELEIEQVKFFKNLVILKFRGLDRIEDVEGFRGCALYVTRENAVKLEEGEYFIADLIGLDVYADELPDKAGSAAEAKGADSGAPAYGSSCFLGELTDVLQTGANDVYEVTLEDGREVLIPAIRQCILDVDIEKGTMLVHLLEGLLE
ncbi:MAG: ribosome maturation factor RimM [Lachnospiraceae bacterium]|nr:ribosome maturation factor RimM [Lachnospiraceae bacterium]